jgi:L-iditol 2-dehydrogenase
MLADTGRRKEIIIQNIRRQVDCVEPALEDIAAGTIKVRSMVTHRFEFKETPGAFELVAGYHDGVMKVMIDVHGKNGR